MNEQILKIKSFVGTLSRQPLTKLLMGVLLIGVALSSASCAGELPTATPTAIPLLATVTPKPRPTLLPTMPATAKVSPTMPLPTATPAERVSIGPSDMDDLLARRATEDFLARLVRGDIQGASTLYLTESVLQSSAGTWISGLQSNDARLAEAMLLEFRRATVTSYEARVLLHWATDSANGASTQTMTLRLAYRQGLWRIEDISLGDLQSMAPSPTARPAGNGKKAALQGAGRIVFQVSSGGDIYLINADGSGLSRLTDGLDPAWSPDGQKIALIRWRHPWGIYLIAPDGSGEERIVDGSRLKEVAWSPDGSQIAFTINRGSSEPIDICFFGFCFTIPPFSMGQVWTVNLNSGEYLNLPLDDQAVHAPTWSPTGHRVVYAGERGLSWIDLDSMETGRFEGGSVWDTSPAYSPNGKQISFMGRVHNRWEIFVMNADGSGRRQITHTNPQLEDPPANVAPAWSPDGKQIAFLSNRDGPWRIYVMKADGSQQRSMFGASLDHLGLRYEWATEQVISWTE